MVWLDSEDDAVNDDEENFFLAGMQLRFKESGLKILRVNIQPELKAL